MIQDGSAGRSWTHLFHRHAKSIAMYGSASSEKDPKTSRTTFPQRNTRAIMRPIGEGRGFPGDSVVKNPPAHAGDWVQSLYQEDPLEEEMATHSSILAWRIPCTEEPGGLWSMGLQRVGHDWAAKQQHNKERQRCSIIKNPASDTMTQGQEESHHIGPLCAPHRHSWDLEKWA